MTTASRRLAKSEALPKKSGVENAAELAAAELIRLIWMAGIFGRRGVHQSLKDGSGPERTLAANDCAPAGCWLAKLRYGGVDLHLTYTLHTFSGKELLRTSQDDASKRGDGMELAEKFARVIAYCGQIPLAQFERDRLQLQLEYFRKQALCDLDRRDSPLVIAQNFKVLLQSKKIENVLAVFRSQPTFWTDVAVFVGDANFVVSQKAWSDPRRVSVTEFFKQIASDARTMSESQRLIKLLVRFGLRAIILEAERPPELRSLQELEYIWRTIWPVLEKAGLLQRYQGDEPLKQRVKHFIAHGRDL